MLMMVWSDASPSAIFVMQVCRKSWKRKLANGAAASLRPNSSSIPSAVVSALSCASAQIYTLAARPPADDGSIGTKVYFQRFPSSPASGATVASGVSTFGSSMHLIGEGAKWLDRISGLLR